MSRIIKHLSSRVKQAAPTGSTNRAARRAEKAKAKRTRKTGETA